MKKFLTLFLALLVCAGLSPQLLGQTPFFTEDFDGALPPDWSAIEVKGDMSATSNWMHTTVGPTGAFAVDPLNSTTADNGWMIFDSDLNCSGEQDVWLVSPQLDLSDKDMVVLQFETFYRRFNDLTWVEVSTDSANWTSIPVFEGLENNQYGDGSATGDTNPQIVTLDISDLAANQSSVWFAFHFVADSSTVQAGTDIGCGYSWQIDDVRLLDMDPTPSIDLRLGDFFYPPASFAQPVSQVATETMGFSADVSNIGLSTVTNVVLKAEVLDEDDNVLFVDSLLIPEVDTSVTDSTFALPNLFAPELPVGAYFIRYSLYSLDGEDGDMSNNMAGDPFLVTENLYSKENQTTTAFRPGGGPNDYVIGNLYITSPNMVDAYQATTVTFSAAKNQSDGNLEGDVVTLVLCKVRDDVVAPDWSDFDTGSDFASNDGLSIVGIKDHTFTSATTFATESDTLDDFTTFTPGVPLEPGTRYLLLASYAGDNNIIFHGFNQDFNYFQISTVVYDGGDGQWFLGGFGPENSAVLRMQIDLLTTTDEKPLPDEAFTLFPNPAASVVHADIELEQPSTVNVTLAEMSGRVIRIEERENLQRERLSFDVSNLPAGTYLLSVATEEGTKTRPFIVQH